MDIKNFRTLESIKGNDKIAHFCVIGQYKDNLFLIPDYSLDTPFNHLDIGACIEYTLHQMLDNGFTDKEIYFNSGIENINNIDDFWQENENENNYYIDLDYGFSDLIENVWE